MDAARVIWWFVIMECLMDHMIYLIRSILLNSQLKSLQAMTPILGSKHKITLNEKKSTLVFQLLSGHLKIKPHLPVSKVSKYLWYVHKIVIFS